jgi:phosphohistidine phosphatase SixA
VKAMLAALLVSLGAQAQEVLVLVRHAEKLDASRDTKLSPAGEARARALAAKLRDAGITSIWTSEFRRTQDTATPLAEELKLKPRVHPAADSKGLVTLLRKEGGRALVVGHANTLPEIARLYGASLPELHEEDFDGLFVIANGAASGGPATLVKLRQ